MKIALLYFYRKGNIIKNFFLRLQKPRCWENHHQNWDKHYWVILVDEFIQASAKTNVLPNFMKIG